MELAGKVAVVTGGASGIGEAMCHAFAAEGARGVVVADIDGEGAQRVADALVAAGTDAFAQHTNAGDEADVQALVAVTEQRYGPVDLFAANAGIMVIGGVEVPDKHWDRIWNVNVQSHIYAARAVLPSMLERRTSYLDGTVHQVLGDEGVERLDEARSGD